MSGEAVLAILAGLAVMGNVVQGVLTFRLARCILASDRQLAIGAEKAGDSMVYIPTAEELEREDLARQSREDKLPPTVY